MGNIFIPSEDDLRRWVREAVIETLEMTGSKGPPSALADTEPLLTRKEIAHMFRISLVTLHDWMKRGLPCNKQRGRVYFLRSEVMRYIQDNRRKPI